MTRRLLMGFLATGLLANECRWAIPCASVYPDSILFTATVVDEEPIEGTLTLRFHLAIEEPFAGVPDGTKQFVLNSRPGFLKKGHRYLIDATQDFAKYLYFRQCGVTAEIITGESNDMLDFLRLRAQGQTITALAVRVTGRFRPLADIAVTAVGQKGTIVQKTNPKGVALFLDIKPDRYRLSAAKEHYRPDRELSDESEVAVLSGTCASARIFAKADGLVVGTVRDSNGAPVPALDLEMLLAPPNPTDPLAVEPLYFITRTDVAGRFRFEDVSPGTYFVGANLNEYGSTSSVPITFYPGTQKRSEAIPVEVKLGSTAGPLDIRLPDFGNRRRIRLCAVDRMRKPLPFAEMGSVASVPDSANLSGDYKADETGCVNLFGYSKLNYRVSMRVSGSDLRSEDIPILAGENPVDRILVLSAGRR